MALFSVNGMRIKGIAAAVPKAMESNRDYERISEAERNLLIRTTGITTRHIASPGMTTADFCQHAAEKLIEELKWQKSEIDLVIFVSQSPDHFLPASSILLQHKLGLPKTTAAFDISLGCSGYVYGLSVVSSLISTGGFRKALLMTGDISSHSITPEDKSTWPLFGDAGTATAIEFDPSSKSFFNLQSDGSGANAIIIPDGGLRNPINEKTFIKEEVEKGIVRHRRNLWLNGLDVFNFSVREAPSNIKTLMEFSNVNQESIDFFVFHQANLLMNETIRKKLKVPSEKVPYSLAEFGNTSSASIPLTIVSQLKSQTSTPKKWLFSGFGVGLSWASAYLETENILCPDVLYI
ncbi:MAG: ketoacyl-ACP synthase III [Bacteroidetes bacterium]|nr:ketoacyl-ACP synthase III [Bacteroidota bacterium]